VLYRDRRKVFNRTYHALEPLLYQHVGQEPASS
jgi:hypothetical protein